VTGPEHYRKAGELLREWTEKTPSVMGPGIQHPTPAEVALAQVHATLALAAATAVGPLRDGGTPKWRKEVL